jgi:hypothetical protein
MFVCVCVSLCVLLCMRSYVDTHTCCARETPPVVVTTERQAVPTYVCVCVCVCVFACACVCVCLTPSPNRAITSSVLLLIRLLSAGMLR